MRLLTRSDFDGLICAVLLKEAGIMDDWKFVHPKDVQDGKVAAGDNDILANVPYAPGCGLWFDHHSSEQERLDFNFSFQGVSRLAPSCARVIWDYYGGHKTFPERFDRMLEYVDRCDSGNLTVAEIENPSGWILLSFIMDPRTGLGRYRDYRISNYQLMEKLVEMCRIDDVETILKDPDVRERIERYYQQDALFRDMLKKRGTVHGNVVLLDFREQDEIYTGNRFVVYTMFPDCNVSVQVIWGKLKQNTVITVGHSITNRTCKTDVGALMLEYGGGGHSKVGTCQVDTSIAEEALADIMERLQKNG
jgi:nanoRNase/pAp phosphatase (c-di-AMP/oligoRNAs hydrolase)